MYLFQFESLFEVQLNKFDGFIADKEEELDEFSVIVGFVSIKISGSEHLSDSSGSQSSLELIFEVLVASEVDSGFLGVDGSKSFLGHLFEVREDGHVKFGVLVAHELKAKLSCSSQEAVSTHLKLLERCLAVVVDVDELREEHLADFGGFPDWHHASQVFHWEWDFRLKESH